MDLTHFVGFAGIKENSLSGCGFPGIDVRCNTDISDARQRL
jgi:hypothetical protein